MLAPEVVYGLAELDWTAWDALAAGHSFYSSSGWLASVESSERPTHEPAYHQVFDDGRLVAALPSYRVETETSGPYTLEVIGSGEWVDRKVLIAGNRRAYVSEWLVDPALTGQRRSEALRTLARSVLDRAEEAGADTVVLPFLTHDSMRLLRAEGLIGAPFLGSADASILLPEPSFDAYLARLSAPARRRTRREMTRFAAAAFEQRIERLDECADEVGVLFGNLQTKYGVPAPGGSWLGVVRDQAEHLGEQSLVFTARRDGRLAGFALGFVWGDRLYMRYTGYDYEATAGTLAYFNLSYYEPVRYACEHGCTAVDLGLASFGAKTSRGATLRPIWTAALLDGRRRTEAETTAENAAARRHATALLEMIRSTPDIRLDAFDPEAFDLDRWLG